VEGGRVVEGKGERKKRRGTGGRTLLKKEKGDGELNEEGGKGESVGPGGTIPRRDGKGCPQSAVVKFSSPQTGSGFVLGLEPQGITRREKEGLWLGSCMGWSSRVDGLVVA